MLNYLLSGTIKNSLVVVTTIVLGIGFSRPTFAQTTPDNSLGSESSVVTPNVEVRGETADRIDGGAIRDRNLFHSFSEFNVAESQRVFFANPDNIERIFTRVTGSNPSNILGTLGVDGAADLLLLNPNGILFGVNSSLDVEGSFFGTSADSLLFADDGEFSASQPSSSLLSVSVPLGLQFGNNPGAISVRSSFLSLPNDQNFSLVGGEVNLSGEELLDGDFGFLDVSGGRVELGGLSTAGTVGISEDGTLSFPQTATKADVILNNFTVDVSAGGGGDIVINAQNLELLNGSLRAGIDDLADATTGQAGDIIINVAENILLESTNDISLITNSTGELSELIGQEDFENINTQGNAGNVIINTTTLEGKGSFSIGSFTNGEGNSGNVNIAATESVNLFTPEALSEEEGNSAIFSAVGDLATGNGANITIDTPSLTLSNSALSTSTNGMGNAGNISINTGELIIRDDSTIDADTFASGAGGQINIEAELIELNDSAIFAEALGTGNAGNISLDTGQLRVNNALISTSSVFDNTDDAGTISIRVQDSFQANNGSISSTSTQSSGGDIDISAGDIRLRGNSDIRTNVETGVGDGGNINLTADSILILNDSDIIASAANGAGGNITLDTDVFFAAPFNSALLNANSELLDFNNQVNISATGSLDGLIDIPEVNFLSNSLIKLAEDLIKTDEVVANSCVVRNGRPGGTFIITGSGGLPSRPGDGAVPDYSTGTVRTLPDSKSDNNWQPGDPIIEPERVYRLDNGKLILSRRCG